MNSTEIKTKVLHYYRFKRRFHYIATEAGAFNSDILVSDGREVIEIEVKTSWQDVLNDFKKAKHKIYSNPTHKYHFEHTPNKFFFAVPSKLVSPLKDLIKKSSYGIIDVSEAPMTNRHKDCYCTIVKQAIPIRLAFPSKMHHGIILRMGSELVRYRMNHDVSRLRVILAKYRRLKKLKARSI